MLRLLSVDKLHISLGETRGQKYCLGLYFQRSFSMQKVKPCMTRVSLSCCKKREPVDRFEPPSTLTSPETGWRRTRWTCRPPPCPPSTSRGCPPPPWSTRTSSTTTRWQVAVPTSWLARRLLFSLPLSREAVQRCFDCFAAWQISKTKPIYDLEPLVPRSTFRNCNF